MLMLQHLVKRDSDVTGFVHGDDEHSLISETFDLLCIIQPGKPYR